MFSQKSSVQVPPFRYGDGRGCKSVVGLRGKGQDTPHSDKKAVTGTTDLPA